MEKEPLSTDGQKKCYMEKSVPSYKSCISHHCAQNLTTYSDRNEKKFQNNSNFANIGAGKNFLVNHKSRSGSLSKFNGTAGINEKFPGLDSKNLPSKLPENIPDKNVDKSRNDIPKSLPDSVDSSINLDEFSIEVPPGIPIVPSELVDMVSGGTVGPYIFCDKCMNEIRVYFICKKLDLCGSYLMKSNAILILNCLKFRLYTF